MNVCRHVMSADGAGKSSLASSILREQFVDRVPACIDPITIPADVSPLRMTTQIVDTTQDTADAEIAKASVVCVVYNCSAASTSDPVVTRWMQRIVAAHGPHGCPTVVIAAQLDRAPEGLTSQAETIAAVKELLATHRFVDTWLACSAKTMYNVARVRACARGCVETVLIRLLCGCRPLSRRSTQSPFRWRHSTMRCPSSRLKRFGPPRSAFSPSSIVMVMVGYLATTCLVSMCVWLVHRILATHVISGH
jgi:hypothetical protein